MELALYIRLFFLFFVTCSCISLKASINPRISAKSALLINAKTGQVLFEKNKNVKRAPGSLTKVALILAAIDRIPDFDKKVKSPPYCLKKMSKARKMENNYDLEPYILEPDGMSFGIYNNEILTVRDLLYGVFLSSGNDAANVLAHEVSNGDINGFMKVINDNLKAIGCKNTTFYNPHGLHYPNHVSTVEDLAIMAKEALKDPRILEIASSVKYQRPKTNKQPTRTVWSSNKLLRRGYLHYPKAKGLKTGNHEIAGFCFIGFAEDENRSLISVVLGCKNAETAFKETTKLFDLAFAEKSIERKLLNCKEAIYTKKVPKAKSLLKASMKNDVSIKFYPSEEVQIKPQLVWYKKSLPIHKGDKVGHVLIVSEDENHFFQAESLYAMEDVEKTKPILLKLTMLITVFLMLLAAVVTVFRKSVKPV